MISNEVLEISLHNPEENESVARETSVEESCKTEPVSIENISEPDESEPRIGIIKLGEDCKANENLVKNLVCEYCGKKFNKSNQLFVHTRIHTSKFQYFQFKRAVASGLGHNIFELKSQRILKE